MEVPGNIEILGTAERTRPWIEEIESSCTNFWVKREVIDKMRLALVK